MIGSVEFSCTITAPPYHDLFFFFFLWSLFFDAAAKCYRILSVGEATKQSHVSNTDIPPIKQVLRRLYNGRKMWCIYKASSWNRKPRGPSLSLPEVVYRMVLRRQKEKSKETLLVNTDQTFAGRKTPSGPKPPRSEGACSEKTNAKRQHPTYDSRVRLDEDASSSDFIYLWETKQFPFCGHPCDGEDIGLQEWQTSGLGPRVGEMWNLGIRGVYGILVALCTTTIPYFSTVYGYGVVSSTPYSVEIYQSDSLRSSEYGRRDWSEHKNGLQPPFPLKLTSSPVPPKLHSNSSSSSSAPLRNTKYRVLIVASIAYTVYSVHTYYYY